jgi:hypothetical protein
MELGRVGDEVDLEDPALGDGERSRIERAGKRSGSLGRPLTISPSIVAGLLLGHLWSSFP